MPSLFVSNGKQITDPLEIANRFCEYFTNVGPSLASKLPDSEISHNSYLTNRIFETIFLKPVTVTELKETANSFNPGKACCFDRIKIDADIKCNIDSIAAPLAHIINQSISTGIVPNDIKTARVIPILVGFIRFQFSAHGGQLYKRISLESSLNLVI